MFGMVVSIQDALQTETPHLAYTPTFVPRAFRTAAQPNPMELAR
jgi:hypothetical protein